MFQLKMTEMRSFKSSQILINSSWLEAAHILKTWQTLCSLEITFSPRSMPFWHQRGLPATDQGEEAQKGPPGISCHTGVQNDVCREETDNGCNGMEVTGRKSKARVQKRTQGQNNRLWRRRISRKGAGAAEEFVKGKSRAVTVETGREGAGGGTYPLCLGKRQ